MNPDPKPKTIEERIAAMPPEQRARFEAQSDGSDLAFHDADDEPTAEPDQSK